MIDGQTVRFRVFRYKRGDNSPHYDEFPVTVGPKTSVLDVLVGIRRGTDPTLTLRHSCFHASCGTCGMRVNEREVLACVTNVLELNASVVTVEPLVNAGTLVSDLVVDMGPFYDRFAPAGRPLLRDSELVPGSVPADGIAAVTRFEDCIECGICVSACPIASTDPRYVGPAGLAAAWRVVEEPRDASPRRALEIADSEQGIWRCHSVFECTEACPSNVDPGGAIMHLRRRAIGHKFRALFAGGRSER